MRGTQPMALQPRASGPVIHWLSPDDVPMRPSSDVAIFRVTCGRISALPGSSRPFVAEESGEIARGPEVLVDRGVADIGHLIDALQRLHDEVADDRGRDLGLAQAFQLAHDRG